MNGDELTPPVADDDFPEFAAPPRHRPDASHESQRPREEEVDEGAQAEVDDVIARLRRERAERER
jgi:hypothetical protein